MRCLVATLLLLGLASLGCNRPNNPAPATNSPTNTGVNARDRNNSEGKEPVTGQDENSADIKITAEIRRKVVEEMDSVNARNVKIMTSKGMVLLRGPVDNQAQKDRIAAIAQGVAGKENVQNDLEVVNGAVVPPTEPSNVPPPSDTNPPPADPKDAPKVLPPVTPPVVPPTDPPAPAPAPGTEPAVKPEAKG